MNWTAIGAIAELVGALMVVVSLVYLSVQIRQNTKATRAEATASVASEMEHALLAVAQSDELANAYLKAAQGQELSPVERVRLLFWWSSFVRNVESHVLQARLGVVGEEIQPAIMLVVKQFVQVPFLKSSLQEMIAREIQTKAFRDWIIRNVLS